MWANLDAVLSTESLPRNNDTSRYHSINNYSAAWLTVLGRDLLKCVGRLKCTIAIKLDWSKCQAYSQHILDVFLSHYVYIIPCVHIGIPQCYHTSKFFCKLKFTPMLRPSLTAYVLYFCLSYLEGHKVVLLVNIKALLLVACIWLPPVRAQC